MRTNNNYFQTVAILCLAFLALKSFPSYSQVYNADQSINIAKSHLEVSQAYSNKSSYPRTVNSNGTTKRVSAGDWTCGFFPGALWLMYEYTGDNTWKSRAQEWTAGLENQKNNTTTHDVGFMIYSSFGNGYRLTQDGNYKSIIIKAAQSLSTRYNPTVGAIKSWNNVAFTYPVIIDNMMNLELLFYATKLSGDSSFYKIAKQHALTTILNHFRPDNSSYHVVDYDPVTGSVIKKVTWQGLNDLSDWARGQAWALYGFTICFRETGDPRFLDMAKKIADFYLTHPNMPSDLVPFWDFDAFDYRDASAAAIAASALLELSDYLPGNSASYYNSGLNILNRLSAAAYSANPGTNNNFFLMHSVGNKPGNSEVDVPLIYADYFFLQALLKHKKPAPTVVATALANQVNLQWNKSTGAASYKINRSLIQGGPYVPIGSDITATIYNDLNVTTGNTYYYTVTPVNFGGDGIASGEVVGSPTGTSTQYSLIVTVAGNGVVTKFPDQASYTEGTTVTLTATAAAGNQFSGWTGDISGATNPISVVMGASNKLINANFVNDLIANVAPATGRFYSVGTLSVGNTFYTDRTYAVTSVPAIIGSATILKPANDDKTNTSGNVVSFTLMQNADLYIAYDPRQTALPSWMNGWQKIPEQLGVSDSKINHLDLYTKYYNAGNVILGGNLASPAAGAQTNYCLIAKEKSTTPVQYVLNTSASGNGSLIRAPDLPSYGAGTSVTLTAVPGANQRFSGWTGAIIGIVNPVNVIMDGNKTIQAAFEPVPADYTLAVNITGAGAVSKNPDQLSYV
ncbi:MAG: glycoside hydrolase family 88 protein, partial [Ginsengibacter sp.]